MPKGIYDRSKCQRMSEEEQEQQNEFKTFWNRYFKELKFYPEGISCGCGCRGRIPVKSDHKYAGVPRYLSSHHRIGKYHTTITKRRIGDSNKIALLGHTDTEETKKNKSISQIRRYQDPKERAKTKEAMNRPIVKAKQRAATIKQWQDPEFVAKQMKARNVCPNKGEIFLDKLLQKLCPNEYRYVGDGEFILSGKCPDFVNVNGQKKIIELFGEPFHELVEEQQRIDLFAKFGYKTLIIWYKELDDIEAVEKKLLEFTI